MPPDELTPEQRDCLSLDRNLAVVAGAGSGKTRVLVARYLEMLGRAGVDNILAVTFTKKAAAEMLERVRREVRARRKSPPPGTDSAKWDDVAEELGRAHISTIHSFCESLLREFPIEAGADPAFQVIEEADRQFLTAECVERTLFDIARDASAKEYEPLSRLLSVYSRGEATTVLEELLLHRHNASPFLEKAAALPFVQLWALLFEKNLKSQQKTLLRALADKGMLSALRELTECKPRKGGDKGHQLVLDATSEIHRLLSATTPQEALAPLHSLADHFTTGEGTPLAASRLGSEKNWGKEPLASFREQVAICAKPLSEYRRLLIGPLGESDKIAAPLLQDLGRLFLRAQEDLASAKGRGRMLDFDDLIQHARNLLISAPNDVRERLRKRYRYVMIDEFQDTDPSQWDIIRRLIGTGGNLPSDAVCVLGDPKQSIYGFRDADVRVIQQVRAQFDRKEDAHRQRVLSGNFRSLQMLVDFQNFLFSRLMAKPEREFDVEYIPMTCERKGGDHLPGRIEILSVELPEASEFDENGEVEENVSADAAEAEMIALKIREITSDPNHLVYVERGFDGKELKRYVSAEWGHIAILLRGRTRLKFFEDALRRHAVPYTVHAGIGYFQRQEVLDVRNILSFLANESDDVALVGALRSPLFGLSDEALFLICQGRKGTLWERLRDFEPGIDFRPPDAEAVRLARRLLPRWQAIADRFSTSELLLTILDDTGFMGSLGGGIDGRQRRANVDKLIEIIRAFEANSVSQGIGLQGLAARLEKLCAGQEREGLAQLELEKSNSVKIMTTHAAKGLEFPIVFLPDLARKIPSEKPELVHIDRELGVGIRIPDPSGGSRKAAMRLASAIQRRRQEASVAEEKRLLYVAVTRARDELYLAGRNIAKLSARRLDNPNSHWAWIVGHLGLTADAVKNERVEFPDPGGRTWEIPITTDPGRIRTKPPPVQEAPLFTLGVPETAPPGAPGILKRVRAELAFIAEPRQYPEFPATALNLYDRCPAAFYLQYMIGIPEDVVAQL